MIYTSAFEILMYVIMCIGSNIAHSVGVVSCFISNLSITHWEVVKRISKYLKGKRKHSICFGGYTTCNIEARGYVYVD